MALAWALLVPGLARAEELSLVERVVRRVELRLSGQAALFLTRDQLQRLRYDLVGVLGDALIGVDAVSWLNVRAGATGGAFLASHHKRTGGLLSPMLGVRLHAPSERISPYLAVDGGPALTGRLVRPSGRISLGVDFGLGRGVKLGPVIGIGQVWQKNGLGYSTDARYFFAGLALAFQPRPPERPKPRVVVQHTERVERVVEVREVKVPAEPVSNTEILQLIESSLPQPQDRVQLLAPVLFRFDSDALEPVGVAMLHEVARLLRERTDIELVAIQGYADRRGSAEYNRDLSLRRAERVREWLVEHGIEAERLRVDPQGASAFVESGDSELEHEQNRRVVFRVLQLRTP